jgi:dUTP pyrophosphatase
MGENEDDFLDKELNELSKIIGSANEMIEKMQLGGNPLAILQNRVTENINPPKQQKPEYNQTIVHCVNRSNNPKPSFAKPGDSGFDLLANLTEPMLLKPMTMVMVPTGLYFEVETGYELQIRSKSSLISKHQVFVLNQDNSTDSQDLGQTNVILFNLGTTEIQINHGDIIAQGIICPIMGSGKLTIMMTDEF